MIDTRVTADGVAFTVLVQPRAARAAIVGAHDKALKIKLTAPPVEGAANKQCIELLAKALGRPKSTVAITGGLTSRHKQVLLKAKSGAMTGEEADLLKRKLADLA